MLNARLMDQPEDFKKLGINQDRVELWEEGRRSKGIAGDNEVWYFDANMEDGTKIVIGFRPKALEKMNLDSDSPNVNIVVTTPDGRDLRDFHYFADKESSTGVGNGCDLKYGVDTAKGDFKQYDVHVEPINGIGADLHYEALVEPFRQGTAIVAFGDNDELHHTDLSVPKNVVTGTIYYDGKVHEVKGVGYHDHQWMNASPMALYHHWLWGRMYTDKYTVYIYDFVTNEKYGFKPIMMFGLLDNETGKVVFTTDGNFTRDTKLEKQAPTGREFPKESKYVFKNVDGKEVDFNVTWVEQIENTNWYDNATEEGKKQFDALNLSPIYTRYYAKGEVTFTDKTNNTKVTSSGDMIYEYPYFGNPDERANV